MSIFNKRAAYLDKYIREFVLIGLGMGFTAEEIVSATHEYKIRHIAEAVKEGNKTLLEYQNLQRSLNQSANGDKDAS